MSESYSSNLTFVTNKKSQSKSDERLKQQNRLKGWIARPELGAISGTILVFLFFFIVAKDTGMFSLRGVINWMEVSCQLVILSTGACLLMIAGEFDLSIGSMIRFAGMVIAIPTTHLGVADLVVDSLSLWFCAVDRLF